MFGVGRSDQGYDYRGEEKKGYIESEKVKTFMKVMKTKKDNLSRMDEE